MPDAQSNSRNCWKCEVMYYHGHIGNKGVCAAGGAHDGHVDAGGAWNSLIQHGLRHDERYNLDQFRNCWKCQALVYDGMDRKGVCPAGGVHDGHADAALYNFVLSFAGPALIE